MENEPEVVPGTVTRSYSRTQVRDGALLLLTGLALYLCWLLAKPFLVGITWALALAVVAYPMQARLERRLPPNLSAPLSLVAIVIVLLAPGAFLLHRALNEASGVSAAIGQSIHTARIQEMNERFPLFARIVDWIGARFDLNQELKGAAGALMTQASALLGGSIRLITQIVVMLVALYYFLRDRKRLLQYLRRLVPLSQAETDELFRRVSETIYATIYSNIVVKLVQGALGGAMFWALGLPAPVLCGLAMALFAMVPLVGTSLVWGPAAIYLLIQGSWAKALVLALWGSLVVSLMDNFLYPFLVAKELRVHALGILLSVLGGLITFGIAGIVLGPVILASTTALLEVWRRRAESTPERSS